MAMSTSELILVADNIRSIENTGALFRLADGVGAKELILVGITPYPDLGEADTRRPWLRHRVTERLRKTALSGFEVAFRYFEKQVEAIVYLHQQDAFIVAVEQTSRSIVLNNQDSISNNQIMTNYQLSKKGTIALVVGHEVEGVSREFVEAADLCVEIPMYGKGKSLNVSVAAGIAAYWFKGM